MATKTSDLEQKLRTWKGKALTHVVLNEAADEIKRLSDENTVLRKAVGEENRANRMTLLYESAQTEIERLRAEINDSTKALSRNATALMRQVDDNSVLRQEINNLHSEINYLRLQIVRLSIPQEDTHG